MPNAERAVLSPNWASGLIFQSAHAQDAAPLLGEVALHHPHFAELPTLAQGWQSQAFKQLSIDDRLQQIHQTLLDLIDAATMESFLLAAVAEFIDRVNQAKILDRPYSLAAFEHWLESCADISLEEKRLLRAKIVGKHLPVEAYQAYFPVGLGRTQRGPHWVTAHNPPDIDTSVASFWGFVDAFGARVTSGAHYWNLPGGTPVPAIQRLFSRIVGAEVLRTLPVSLEALQVTAGDLLSDEKIPASLKRPIVAPSDSWDRIRQVFNDEDCPGLIVQDADGSIIGWIDRKVILDGRAAATVSLRDFCNRDEVKISSEIEIISVIDHHRTSLNTKVFPIATIADVQSCNVLVAEEAIRLNDRYGVGGLSLTQISEPLPNLDDTGAFCEPTLRLAGRMVCRKLAAATRGSYWVHPNREYAEYLSCLMAILDDTDLLSRATMRDVDCVIQLLNRMKSLVCGHEVETIALDDLPRDVHFVSAACRRILQNPDMYSLYKEIYRVREQEVSDDLSRCIAGECLNAFADTKEQKGIARVGQTKLFPSNFALFAEQSPQLRRRWLSQSAEAFEQSPQLDLHLHMISTIASADDVYSGNAGQYGHCDELWLWVPPNSPRGRQYLEHFLSSFRGLPALQENAEVVLVGDGAHPLKEVVERALQGVPLREEVEGDAHGAMAVLRFKAGEVTSRKLNITPHLPNPDLGIEEQSQE